MTKYIIISFIALLPRFSHAQIYVSTTGSDATGDGSVGSPYATFPKAVSVATSGNTIFLKEGTYSITSEVAIPAGVNIDGDGQGKSIVNSTVTSGYMLNLTSTFGTSGNQFIRNVTWTGSDTIGVKGIMVLQRNDVKIYNCTFRDFLGLAVNFVGDGNNFDETEPANYATGNEFYNDSVINCSERQVAGGMICIGGQDGLYIHDNYLNQTQRNIGYNGNIIGAVQGHNKNLRYERNTSVKPEDGGDYTLPGEGWNFHIESWFGEGGNQIIDNNFLGGGVGIDISGTYNKKGTSAFAWKIKGNRFSKDTQDNLATGHRRSMAIDLESNNEKIIVDSNFIINHESGVGVFGLSPATLTDSIYITRNVFSNIGSTDENEPSFVIGIMADKDDVIQNLFVYNNTISLTTNPASYGILLRSEDNTTKGTIDKLYIKNNIITGSAVGYLAFWEWTGNYTNIISDNNIVYGNGNSNNYYKRSTNTVGITETGSIKSDPLLDADFIPQTGSPAIDAAIDLGYGTSIGAVQIADVVAPPTVTTSGDQTLITNSTTIFSTPVAASGQTITGILWTDITGSGTATITSPTTQNTGITGLSVGTHTFRDEVTQSDGQKAHADVNVTLTAPPTANAGADQTITLPTSSVTLSGSGTVAAGQTATYLWTKVSGAGTQTISGNTTLTPTVSGMTTAGDYVFELKVTQTDTQFALSTVTVHVNASSTPQAPVINLRKPTIVIQIH